ncbi:MULTISPECIES: ImuA family protein [unclassified Haematobacter]|uniref:ImuA family protein n=1 Tax=unclassified Haematobacter TaxID=2640585 RepID=UPI0025BEBB2C|nr:MULTISPECIES: hypothetical protein [unclassified Haematobacter]
MRSEIGIGDPLTLISGRVHEAEGRNRRTFSLLQAVRYRRPVIWILRDHMRERPMPCGLPQGVAERLLIVTPGNETDLLWCFEEALRSRPVDLVIAEPERALSLMEGRRFQLAAEAGRSTGLLLIREGQGSNAAETRWHCEALPGAPDSTLHRWSLNKNKKGTLKSWTVHWNGATAAFHLVPEARERHEPQEAPD